MELTDKQKCKKIEKRLEAIDGVLENPNLTNKVEREIYYQQDVLEALHIRIRFDSFMATLGYKHVRGPEI